MTATQAPTPGPLTAEDWASLADLHTLKGWLHGVSLTPDWNDVVADGGVTVAMVVQQEAGQMAFRVGRVIDNFRLAPTAPVEASGSEGEINRTFAGEAIRDLAKQIDLSGPHAGMIALPLWAAKDILAALHHQPSGFLATLTDDQRAEALAYTGDDTHPQPSGETEEALARKIRNAIIDRTSIVDGTITDGDLDDAIEEILDLIRPAPVALGGQHSTAPDFPPDDVLACEANLSATNAELLEQALSHPPLSTTPARAEAQDEGAAGEPVAWRWRNRPDGVWNYQEDRQRIENVEQQPLYAHPSPTPAADDDRVRIAVEALEKIRGEAYAWTPSKAAHSLGTIAHEALAALKSEGK